VTVTIPTMPNVIIGEDTFILTAHGVVGGYATATGTTQANVIPGGEVVAPEGQTGRPLDVVSYDFMVTNTGDYTDTFALGVTGVWTATLPDGDSTDPLAPGASTVVTVLVTIPEGATQGETDVTTLKITSQLDTSIWTTAEVTTTVRLFFYNLLSIIFK
jgi:hypothetical protein